MLKVSPKNGKIKIVINGLSFDELNSMNEALFNAMQQVADSKIFDNNTDGASVYWISTILKAMTLNPEQLKHWQDCERQRQEQKVLAKYPNLDKPC